MKLKTKECCKEFRVELRDALGLREELPKDQSSV